MLLAGGVASPADAFELGLPIDCSPGVDCFVQNYVDEDPGPEARDFACGGATTDRHDGTDIRVRSLAVAKAGVAVKAAAAGTVTGVRDGVREQFVESDADRAAIKGRECGNGVVIEHGGGYVTQYCHMKRGSVRVKRGQTVAEGEVIGAVGASGLTQFAHLHLAVRLDGKTIDPFTGAGVTGTCEPDFAKATMGSLWRADVLKALGPVETRILDAGFTEGTPGTAAFELGEVAVGEVTRRSPQLVFYVRLMNAHAGDRLAFSVTGPEGFAVDHVAEPLDRAKAVYVGFAGKRLAQGAKAWPAGTYKGNVAVLRDGATVAEQTVEIALGG
ncbi:MAG: M23 family metallopeptidase [Hyphomicrobiaceae bacterium]